MINHLPDIVEQSRLQDTLPEEWRSQVLDERKPLLAPCARAQCGRRGKCACHANQGVENRFHANEAKLGPKLGGLL